MSPQYPAPIAVLAAPGLLWLATTVAFGRPEPAPQGPLASQAPTSAASASADRVLLLSNGTVVRGEITEDAAAGVYRIRRKGGQLPPYPKTAVKKLADSLEELYRFQVQGLPPGDPDERMKLVKWCLIVGLQAQAREQLEAILAMSPEDAEAKRMYYNLQASSERGGPVDPALRQTSGEMPRVDAPGNLDPAIVKRVRRGFGPNVTPEVFDLPPAVAVKRANEFAEYVQPVLQKNCAGCHNERYPGDFQLVEVRSRRDRSNPDISRANLEATLRLVNPEDPARSELLSAGLVPHGPNKGAIFQGPADPQYRMVVTWVRLLKPAGRGAAPAPAAAPPLPPAGGVTRTGYEPPAAEGFGSGRAPRPGSSNLPNLGALPALPGTELLSAARADAPPPPAAIRKHDHHEESADFSGGYPDAAFPVPFAAGGPAPQRPAAKAPAKGPSPKGRTPAPAPVATEDEEPAPAPSAPAGTRTPAIPIGSDGRAVIVGETDNPNRLPGMDLPMYPTPPKAEGDPKKPKSKLDPAALEKLMRSRNGAP